MAVEQGSKFKTQVGTIRKADEPETKSINELVGTISLQDEPSDEVVAKALGLSPRR